MDGTDQHPGRLQGKQEGNLEGNDLEIPHPAEEEEGKTEKDVSA